ncbi:MAG: MOSC domain-containing protein [Neomegalonema sp.]|nr:MOSC domain-containing protein [Neomegalonema sp.]
MPILSPTKITGTVRYLGINPDRAAGLQSQPREQVTVTYDGFEGEAHGGLTRASCSRVMLQYPKGTEIRNVRQLTILSEEELAQIGAAMDLPEAVQPEWTGANLVLSGIPQLTMLPPGARLIFGNGTSLAVDMENGPCKFVGEVIEALYPGKGRHFPKFAQGKRGVTAFVERPGAIALGDTCTLHIPPQRIYEPALAAATP